MTANEKLEQIVGKTISSVEPLEYSGYGVLNAVRLYLSDGSIVELRSSTTHFDQYSSDPSMEVSLVGGSR